MEVGGKSIRNVKSRKGIIYLRTLSPMHVLLELEGLQNSMTSCNTVFATRPGIGWKLQGFSVVSRSSCIKSTSFVMNKRDKTT